jgi:hypothetical protein
MAKLIYSAITSLDGYAADEDGNFDWAEPDEEAHTFVNDLERPVRTYLYGRRMYEVMAGWETDQALAGQAADKVVYSTMLATPSTAARTRIERAFDPEAVRRMKAAARTSPPRRSGPDWSTSSTCCSRPSWSAAATRPSPTRSASGWSCWTSAGSATAWSICATAPVREELAPASCG